MSGQPVPVFDYSHNQKAFLKRHSLSAVSKVNTLLFHYTYCYTYIFLILLLYYTYCYNDVDVHYLTTTENRSDEMLFWPLQW